MLKHNCIFNCLVIFVKRNMAEMKDGHSLRIAHIAYFLTFFLKKGMIRSKLHKMEIF